MNATLADDFIKPSRRSERRSRTSMKRQPTWSWTKLVLEERRLETIARKRKNATASDNSGKLIPESLPHPESTPPALPVAMNMKPTVKQSLPKKEMPKPDDPLYKTVLCKNFADKGKCKYGKRCTFAHGKEELRQRPRRRPRRRMKMPKPTPQIVEKIPAFQYKKEDFPPLPNKRVLEFAKSWHDEEVEVPTECTLNVSYPPSRMRVDAQAFVPRMHADAPAFEPRPTPMTFGFGLNPLAVEFCPAAIQCAEFVLSDD